MASENLIKKTGETNTLSNPEIIQLYSLVVTKHMIGKYVWYILAGLLIASITYNSIIGMSCVKSVDEYKSDYEDIYVNDKTVLYGNVWEKVSSSQITDKRNANDTYSKLIRMYNEKFTGNEVTLTTDELNRAGIIYEIPDNIYITIRNNNEIYVPIA